MGDPFDRHKLTTIFYADIAGYSRLTARDVQLVEGEQARASASGMTDLQAWECLRQGAFYAVHRVEPEFKQQACPL
jgi:hypothetical protein